MNNNLMLYDARRVINIGNEQASARERESEGEL